MCISGPLATDSDCLIYASESLYETEKQCATSTMSALTGEDMQAMLSMPDFDYDIRHVDCINLNPMRT